MCSMLLAAALHVVLARFTEAKCSVQNLVHLDDDGAGRVEEPLACARRAVWGIFYADNAGVVSKWAEGLAKTMTVMVTVVEAVGLTALEKKTETMLLQTRDLASRVPPFVIEEAGHRHKQKMQFLYLGDVIHVDADLMVKIKRPVRLKRACYKRFGPELYLYDMTIAWLSLKVRLFKADAIETCCTGVGPSMRLTMASSEGRNRNSSGESLVSSVVRTTPTSRTPRPSRRRKSKASKRPSGNGGSSPLGQCYGKTGGG